MDAIMVVVNSTAGSIKARVETSEKTLIDRARAMDGDAWDQLFSEHHSAIYRYVHIRLGNKQAAEDLASEVFLQAVRSISRYRYRGISFRAWLYRIAHNVTADHRRRMATRTKVEAPTNVEDLEPSQPDFAPIIAQRGELETAIRELTDEQQQVVILRFVEGMSVAETAEATKRTPGAVKALQHRGVNRLRQLIKRGEG
jgi:RNA polymerase sigma-70 factor (ECF subfamily)